MVVTADGGWRRGNEVKLKAAVDEALKETPSVKTCIVVRRTGMQLEMQPGRDFWWHELMENANPSCEAEDLIVSTLTTFSTLQEQLVNQKASCIRPQATCFKRT